MSLWIGIAVYAVIAAAAAWWLTGVARAYAIGAQLFDAPNARSSHAVATPRGGGVSIIAVGLIGFAVSWALFGLELRLAIGLIGGGMIVSAVGWLDDHGHVPARYRLAAHATGMAWTVAWIGPMPFDLLPFWPADWYWPMALLSVAAGVWLINLYNFMDGIDGLAAVEAVSINLGGAALLLAGGASLSAMTPAIGLAAASIGFLWWNWPPARIFMGDASSGFLGFCVAGLACMAARIAPAQGVAWLLMAGVFLADATVTLGRRLVRGERVYEAHRLHAYQRWARRLGRHLPVTLGAVAVTWLWLFPVSWASVTGMIDPLAAGVIALLPLFAVAWLMGAGRREAVAN